MNNLKRFNAKLKEIRSKDMLERNNNMRHHKKQKKRVKDLYFDVEKPKNLLGTKSNPLEAINKNEILFIKPISESDKKRMQTKCLRSIVAKESTDQKYNCSHS